MRVLTELVSSAVNVGMSVILFVHGLSAVISYAEMYHERRLSARVVNYRLESF